MSDFRVDPEGLRGGASGILKCLEPAESVDLEALSRNVEAFGHSGSSGAFGQFCVTWQVACLLLHSRATSAAETLNGVAGTYVQSDDDAGQSLNRLRPGLQ
ncbi:hypothetical protein AB0C51_09775 [Streptomyces pathocidini]|uniref:hypothetical protein n=1 Tax=Streptomyces pathocidini TaxID=1650571 RepID=UPI0033F5AD75